jgi:hypothetical protein
MDSSYMTIDSNEDIKLIRETARNFADKYIRPHLMEWDEAQYFPRDVFTKMGELGFMGVVIPEEYGGTGLNYQAYITIIEEVSKVCGSVGLSLAAHNSLGTNHIYMFGSDNFGKKWMILFLPIVSTVLFIGLTLLNYFPESFNYPTKINEDNALIQYTYATRLIRYLKLVIVFIFGILLYQTTRYPLNKNDGLGIWFLPLFLGLIFIPLIFYVLKSVKSK